MQNNRDVTLLSSSDASHNPETAGRAQGRDGCLCREAGHLGECPCCGGPARVSRRPSHAQIRGALRNTAGGGRETPCGNPRIHIKSSSVPCPGGGETRSEDLRGPEEPLGPLPLRSEAPGRDAAEVEALPWASLGGLKAHWGGLVDFGLAGLSPVDGSRIVEPWGLRMARSAALSVGAWGLGAEIRSRRLVWLWTSRLRGLWVTPRQPIHRRAFRDGEEG